jgi:hypothetical protein
MQTQYIPLPKQAKDLTSKRFGRLLVLAYAGTDAKRRLLWFCQCDCGQEITISRSQLLSDHVQSCGCLHNEQLITRNRKHGLAKHPLYGSWLTMIARCTNPNTKSYSSYGARGITVCERWHQSFPDFLSDVSALPDFGAPGYSLDRIDNDGNYAPENVRWANRKVQRRNSPANLIIFYGEQSKPLADWADELNMRKGILYNRLRHGWTVERAFTTPVASDRGGHSSRLR